MNNLKKLSVAFGLTLLLPVMTFAETTVIKVKGMFCSFCAQGLEKKFKDAKAKNISVDMTSKTIRFDPDPKFPISEEQARILVESATLQFEKMEVLAPKM